MSSSRIRSTFKKQLSTQPAKVKESSPDGLFEHLGDIKRLTPQAITNYQALVRTNFSREYINHLGDHFYVCDFKALQSNSTTNNQPLWAALREAFRYLGVCFSLVNRAGMLESPADADLIVISEKAYKTRAVDVVPQRPIYVESYLVLRLMSSSLRRKLAQSSIEKESGNKSSQLDFQKSIRKILSDIGVGITSISDSNLKYVQNKTLVRFEFNGERFLLFEIPNNEFTIGVGRKDMYWIDFEDWQNLTAEKLSTCLTIASEISETLDSMK